MRQKPLSSVPTSEVRWSEARRIIRSVHPPIDLFEDIADPADWPLLTSQFGYVTPENSMKPVAVQGKEGRWSFDTPDRFVEFGGAEIGHGILPSSEMVLRGHISVGRLKSKGNETVV